MRVYIATRLLSLSLSLSMSPSLSLSLSLPPSPCMCAGPVICPVLLSTPIQIQRTTLLLLLHVLLTLAVLLIAHRPAAAVLEHLVLEGHVR
jgi:hypothetical protein